MDTTIAPGEVLLRLSLACLFGGLLGIEREWKRKPAGLRTYIMVALGSACFTIVTFELYAALEASGDPAVTRTDPMRIVEGIATGIGFLGAGAILVSGGSVRGLTTASGIWLTGAIGLACGGGHFLVAALASGFGLFALFVLKFVEDRVTELATHREPSVDGDRGDEGDRGDKDDRDDQSER